MLKTWEVKQYTFLIQGAIAGTLPGREKGSPQTPGLCHQRVPGYEDAAVAGASTEAQGNIEGKSPGA